MRVGRTALARFIDMSAMWTLCLIAWFMFLLSGPQKPYGALAPALICSAATIALFYIIRRLIRPHMKHALPQSRVRAICIWLSLMEPQQALEALARQLVRQGIYPDARAHSGLIEARGADGRSLSIALLSRWPDARVTSADVIAVWRRERRLSGPAGGGAVIVSGAELAPDAVSAAEALSIAVIPPAALAALMCRAMPEYSPSPNDGRGRGILKALTDRRHVGRFGTYALVFALAGRIFGLYCFRTVGLLLSILWLICAAQPPAKSSGIWPHAQAAGRRSI